MNCAVPIPLRPAERISSSWKPASGTRRDSIPRCVPTKTTSLFSSRLSHSRATAMAGITWPPVPPPAMSNFKPPFPRLSTHSFTRLLADIQEHACAQKHDEKTRAAIAHERQRNSFRRHHAHHNAQINQGLARHHDRNSQSQEASEIIGAAKTGFEPPPGVNREEGQHERAADKAQLLAQDSVDEIRVRLGKIEKLLAALLQADAGQTARANGDERLHPLKAVTQGIGVGMQ